MGGGGGEGERGGLRFSSVETDDVWREGGALPHADRGAALEFWLPQHSVWLGIRCALFEGTRARSFSHRHGYRVGIPHNLLSSTHPSVSVVSSFVLYRNRLALVDLVLSLRAVTQHGANHPPHIHDAAGEAANAALMRLQWILAESRPLPDLQVVNGKRASGRFCENKSIFISPLQRRNLTLSLPADVSRTVPRLQFLRTGNYPAGFLSWCMGLWCRGGEASNEKSLTERIAFVRHCWIWGGSSSREHNSLAKPTECLASMCFSIPRKAFVGTDAKCRNTWHLANLSAPPPSRPPAPPLTLPYWGGGFWGERGGARGGGLVTNEHDVKHSILLRAGCHAPGEPGPQTPICNPSMAAAALLLPLGSFLDRCPPPRPPGSGYHVDPGQIPSGVGLGGPR